MENFKKRDLNISFYKAGNGIGTRISLPKTWLTEIGITKESKTVELILDEKNKQLIIRKKK